MCSKDADGKVIHTSPFQVPARPTGELTVRSHAQRTTSSCCCDTGRCSMPCRTLGKSCSNTRLWHFLIISFLSLAPIYVFTFNHISYLAAMLPHASKSGSPRGDRASRIFLLAWAWSSSSASSSGAQAYVISNVHFCSSNGIIRAKFRVPTIDMSLMISLRHTLLNLASRTALSPPSIAR